jgi:hypothetical protein
MLADVIVLITGCLRGCCVLEQFPVAEAVTSHLAGLVSSLPVVRVELSNTISQAGALDQWCTLESLSESLFKRVEDKAAAPDHQPSVRSGERVSSVYWRCMQTACT